MSLNAMGLRVSGGHKLGALLRRGSQQPGKPRQRNSDDSAVNQVNPHAVVFEAHSLGRSSHAKPFQSIAGWTASPLPTHAACSRQNHNLSPRGHLAAAGAHMHMRRHAHRPGLASPRLGLECVDADHLAVHVEGVLG